MHEYTHIRTISVTNYAKVSLVTDEQNRVCIMKTQGFTYPLPAMIEVSVYNNYGHPYMGKMIDAYLKGSELNIILEYYPITLRDYVRQSKILLPNNHVKELMKEMLECTHYLHHNKLMNRDIKPSNICMADGHTKMIDFGMARYIVGDNMQNSPSVQTIGYRSPEVVLGRKYGYKIDIWSLGAIFYLLLTGTPLIDVKYIKKGIPDEESMSKSTIDISLNPEIAVQKIQSIRDDIPTSALDLLLKMICLEKYRFSASECLEHPYFSVPRKIPADVSFISPPSLTNSVLIQYLVSVNTDIDRQDILRLACQYWIQSDRESAKVVPLRIAEIMFIENNSDKSIIPLRYAKFLEDMSYNILFSV